MKIKRIVALVLALIMTMPMATPVHASNSRIPDPENRPERSMDELDMMLVAYRYMSSADDEDNIWDDEMFVEEAIPLYDINDEVIAYYLSFQPEGYAIINNNLDNPIPIEFGEGDNQPIREILSNSRSASNPQIVYAGPAYSYDKQARSKNPAVDERQLATALDSLYEILNAPNEQEKILHEESRALVESDYEQTRGFGYSFIHWNNMPSGGFHHATLPSLPSTWAIMSDYNNIAKNHCAPTAATNIALYLAANGRPNMKKNNSVHDTFKDFHSRMGNGPTLAILGTVKAYGTSRGYTIGFSGVSSYEGLKTAIANRRPCGILLASGEWHWVVGVGWRQYTTGACYVRIVNSWHNNSLNFYLWGGPTAISITAFH